MMDAARALYVLRKMRGSYFLSMLFTAEQYTAITRGIEALQLVEDMKGAHTLADMSAFADRARIVRRDLRDR